MSSGETLLTTSCQLSAVRSTTQGTHETPWC